MGHSSISSRFQLSPLDPAGWMSQNKSIFNSLYRFLVNLSNLVLLPVLWEGFLTLLVLF